MPRLNRRAATLVPLLLAGLWQAGCAVKPEVWHDQDAGVDLAGYRSFAFHDPVSTDGLRYSSLLSARLTQATREQLERRRYVYDEQAPDGRVNFRLLVQDQPKLRASGLAGPDWRPHGTGAIDATVVQQATLRVELVDTHRLGVVWQGVAEGRLADAMLKDPAPVVNTVVGEIFAALPASTAGTR